MSVNIRYPNITGLNDKEQLKQIKSYLYQLVDQLNYAMPNASGGSGQTVQVQGEEVSYYELRSMIIKAINEIDQKFAKLSDKMQSDYVSDEELPQAINTALEQAKESGEFDGPPGPQGPKGDPGEPGSGGSGVDDVIESETVDGWVYKKWSGGSYEMFGSFTVTTTTICTDMGSMFCSEVFTLPVPFAMDSAIISGSADDLFLVTSGNRIDDNNISFVLLRPYSFDTEMDIHVRLFVTGICKTGGTQ